MSLTGAVNGTNGVIVKIDGSESTIVGQMEFTTTFTGQPIDVSNKSNGDWVCLMDGELSGKGETASGSILYNSDSIYRAVRDDTAVGTIGQYKIDFGDGVNNLYFSAIPNALSDSIPMGDKVASSITFTSTGAIFGPSNPSVSLDFINERYYTVSLDGLVNEGSLEDILSKLERNSIASYYNSAGLLVTAAANELRINYNPSTLEKEGAFIEESSTNLVFYSEDLSDSSWSKEGTTTVSSNVGTAPDGTTTADEIVDDAGEQGVSQAVTIVDTDNVSLSVYIQRAETTSSVRFRDTGLSKQDIIYDPTTNTITSESSDFVYSLVEDINNDWVRVCFTYTPTSGATSSNVTVRATDPGTVRCWGIQAEQYEAATSYIKTESAQETRLTDVFDLADDGWLNQDNGAVMVDAKFKLSPDRNNNYASLNDNTDDEIMAVRVDISSNLESVFIGSGESTVLGLETSISTADRKVCFAYNNETLEFRSVVDSGTVNSTTRTNVVTTSVLSIGSKELGNDGANSTIKSISYYPINMNDEELQAITS